MATFSSASACAGSSGLTPLEVLEALVGGGSDGNFTSALGVPTLDGLGAVGDGPHAEREHIQLSRYLPRVALLANLLTKF